MLVNALKLKDLFQGIGKSKWRLTNYGVHKVDQPGQADVIRGFLSLYHSIPHFLMHVTQDKLGEHDIQERNVMVTATKQATSFFIFFIF